MSIKSLMLHLYVYSCSCSCSSKLFHLALQANFSRPHKHLSVSSPSPLNLDFFFLFPPLFKLALVLVPRAHFWYKFCFFAFLSLHPPWKATWADWVLCSLLEQEQLFGKAFLGLWTWLISYRNSSPSFSGEANPGLSFSGGKPRSQLHLSQQLREDKAIASSVLRSFAQDRGGGRIWHLSCHNEGSRRCKMWFWDSKHFSKLSWN